MMVELRAAVLQDFAYCRRLYFGEMEWINKALHLDSGAQDASFSQQWEVTQVRIITLDGADVGWLQSFTQGDELFLEQIIVDRDFQRRGIGREVMKHIIRVAERSNQAVCLAVVKINPAVRLYERLGFEITREDDRKFYMKRDPDTSPLPDGEK